jgi:Ca2+-transporting ATPase
MFQFWNMFNAKAFMTGRSAFANLSNCKGFLIVAAIIFVGQIIIVEIGGQMFSVCHLKPSDWLWIILTTSLVLWIGEAGRLVARKK